MKQGLFFSFADDEPFMRETPSGKKKLIKRPTSSIVPLYKVMKYCVYTLCEHEEVCITCNQVQ